MSSIPDEVQRQIDEILKAIREDPEHEFGALRRRELYRAFGDNPVGKRARGWIAVIAARRVLPIYEQTLPQALIEYDFVPESRLQEMAESDEPYLEEWKIPIKGVARRMLEIAEGTLENSIALKTATDFSSNHYYFRLSVFDGFEEDNFDETGEDLLLPQTRWAIHAAYSALVECNLSQGMGVERLDGLERIRRVWHDEQGNVEKSEDGVYRMVSIANDTDFRLAGGEGDAAASAMAANAFDSDSKRQAEKKLEFWEWWLTEAMAQAWEKANESQNNA